MAAGSLVGHQRMEQPLLWPLKHLEEDISVKSRRNLVLLLGMELSCPDLVAVALSR